MHKIHCNNLSLDYLNIFTCYNRSFAQAIIFDRCSRRQSDVNAKQSRVLIVLRLYLCKKCRETWKRPLRFGKFKLFYWNIIKIKSTVNIFSIHITNEKAIITIY